jgi:hypothetical protein
MDGFMSLNLRATALLFIFIVLANVQAYTQSVRGKVIYVSPVQDVKLKFGSAVSNYSFVNKSQATAFKIKQSGKSLHINNALENFKPANLVITEGKNTHLFILAYRSSMEVSDGTVYDFSSKEKIEQSSQKVIIKKPVEPVQNIQVKSNPAETKTIVTQTVVTQPVAQPADKTEPPQIVTEPPARPQATGAAEAVTNKQITSVATSPAKANTETVTKATYSSEITKATLAYKAKQYIKAKGHFQSAQKLNPAAKYPGVRISELNALIAKERKSRNKK